MKRLRVIIYQIVVSMRWTPAYVIGRSEEKVGEFKPLDSDYVQ